MKKSFAGPPNGISLFPERGGVTETLTGLDLTTEVAPGTIFKNSPNFVNNCESCKKSNMKNQTGDDVYGYSQSDEQYGYNNTNPNKSSGGGSFLAGLNLADLLKIGSTIYMNEQQIKLAEQQGQITAQQAAQARAQLAIAKENSDQSDDKSGIIKAYAIPIAISGVVIILGIAAYFFFKKKKIS
jgi:hypothetical protein